MEREENEDESLLYSRYLFMVLSLFILFKYKIKEGIDR